MFINVKRFQQFDDLLLEANIIKFGDEFNGMAQEYDGGDSGATNSIEQGTDDQQWTRLDALIDTLLAQRIIDLDRELQRPLYEKEFGSARGKQLAEAYLTYCKGRIERLSAEIKAELAKEEVDVDHLADLNKMTVEIAARIEALDKIYSAFKLIGNYEGAGVADEMKKKIDEIKQALSSAYIDPLVIIGSKVKTEISAMEKATEIPKKIENAERIIEQLHIIERIIVVYPNETKQGFEQAKQRAEQTVKTEIGEENYERIHEEILNNDHEAGILRRILDIRYMNFTSEQEIYRAADGIKISINGLRNPKSKIKSRPEVIAYLEKQLAEVTDEVLKKARDKSITIDKTKGIHYDFNVKLKLHEVIDLPVTGKQIADASWIMKFRKHLKTITDLLIMGDHPMTAASQAFANFGEAVHKIYAVSLNSTAKLIGRAIKGREGEMKADAISRMFIPGPDVLDKKPRGISQPISEDGEGGGGSVPGVSMQTPGSISGMGPIKAPTATSVGSGDKFSPDKKKKKKKYKSPFESQVKVLNFSTFVNENNNRRNGI
jgi:hypothetical protein